MAERLLGFFPRPSASDQQVFVTGVVELMCAYPLWALERACSVRDGLPSRHEYMPSLKEIREYLDGLVAFEVRRDELMARWSRPALAEPRRDRSKRPTYEQLKARYGPSWGIEQPRRMESAE